MVTVMADPQPDIVEENRLLEQAIRKKRNKFTRSGLLSIIIGLLIIIGGLLLRASPYSAAALLVGFGIILVLIGIIRILIGIINPLTPADLRGIRLPGEESS